MTLLPPPQTVVDFNERFSPYEEKIKQLMKKLEDGNSARSAPEKGSGPGMYRR